VTNEWKELTDEKLAKVARMACNANAPVEAMRRLRGRMRKVECQQRQLLSPDVVVSPSLLSRSFKRLPQFR
jgi:hypothetical protein